MKKTLVAIAATAAALVSVAGTAQAAPGQSINQRQARIEFQIDRGVRTGALTRQEAVNLRSRLATVERLEWSFRRNGLNVAERRVLDNRLDTVERQVRVQLADRQVRGRQIHRF